VKVEKMGKKFQKSNVLMGTFLFCNICCSTGLCEHFMPGNEVEDKKKAPEYRGLLGVLDSSGLCGDSSFA
jgi:hypothetical protein